MDDTGQKIIDFGSGAGARGKLDSLTGTTGVPMAVQAYILIDTSPGKAKEVVGRLRHVAGVISAHAVTGPHDIIALVESGDVSSLGEMVVQRIQSLVGVSRSLTSIVAD